MESKKTICQPLVSIIMPAYNCETYIEEAIKSVLNQSIDEWELIVIDDCSTDTTYNIARHIANKDDRIQVYQNEENMGVAKTRNRGIALCQGEYIAFLDSDDVWCPKKLEIQINRIKEICADICYCSYEIIGANGDKVRPDYVVPQYIDYNGLLIENVMQCSAMLVKANIVKHYMFNTEYYHEDYILGLMMLRDGKRAIGCEEILLRWRYMKNSRSFNKIASSINRWRIYRYFLRLSFIKCLKLFLGYTFAGFRKYGKSVFK